MSWLLNNANGLLRLVGSRRGDGRHRPQGVQCDLGAVLDLSRSGARVRAASAESLNEGEVIAVSLRWGEERCAVSARVVWLAPHGLRGAEAGLEFTDLSEHARAMLQKWAERFALWTREEEEAAARRRAG